MMPRGAICHDQEQRGSEGKTMATVFSLAAYGLAAAAEIAGCFAFWAWLRLGKSALWALPGVAALIVFALLLTRIDSAFAGRAYAAYGGVYIAASLLWLMLVEGARPDRFDLIGAALCIAGAGVILLAPRAA
jgi:small multidrug resistance family-3 protein